MAEFCEPCLAPDLRKAHARGVPSWSPAGDSSDAALALGMCELTARATRQGPLFPPPGGSPITLTRPVGRLNSHRAPRRTARYSFTVSLGSQGP